MLDIRTDFISWQGIKCKLPAEIKLKNLLAGTHSNNLPDYWLSGIYRYHPESETWEELIGGFIYDLLVTPEGDIYAGCSYGVLRSQDNGVSFHRLLEGGTFDDVGDLALDSEGFIYASKGDSLFRSIRPVVTSLSDPVKPKEQLVVTVSPNPVQQHAKFTIKTKSPTRSSCLLSIYNSRGNLMDQLEAHETIRGTYLVEYNTSSLSVGAYFYKVALDNEICTGRFTKL